MLAVRDIVLFLLVHQGADWVERGIKTIVFWINDESNKDNRC